jgi:transketolase
VRRAFVHSLLEAAQADPRLMLVTGDLGFKVLDEFAARFPRQYLNVGVAEQNMIGIATGLALEGRTVFTYSIGNFGTLRCLEQIRNDACYHGANVKVVSVGGGFTYGPLGISHHATEDLAIARALPGMTVVAPGDRWESGLATAHLARTHGTCYLRLDRAGADLHGDTSVPFALGRARTVRDGRDVTMVATGGMVEVAVAAGERLAAEGIECRIVSMHTIKPIDVEVLERACLETGGLVTIEEHGIDGGLGSAVAEACMDRHFVPAAFHRIALRAGFSSIVGSQAYLRERYGLDERHVAQVVRDIARGRCPIQKT